MNEFFAYSYVGPKRVRLDALTQPRGRPVATADDRRAWLHDRAAASEPVTFIVNLAGCLVVAPRRSEHVACAGGLEVLAAGELQLRQMANGLVGSDVTNQSTGYCPDVDCWPVVQLALEAAGIVAPRSWASAFTFRKCPRCSELNVVKEAWFVCALCDAELPAAWNVSARRVVRLSPRAASP